MKKAFLVLFLVLTAVGRGATYYVNGTTGNDTHGNGTETWVDTDSSETWSAGDTGPWATIQKSIDTVSASTHTINVAAGTYGDEASDIITIDTDQSNKTLTLVASGTVIVDTNNATAMISVTGAISTSSIEFQGFTFQGHQASQFGLRYSAHNNDLDLVLTNCIFDTTGDNTVYMTPFYSAAVASAVNRTLTCTGCEINSVGTNPTYEFLLFSDFGNIIFDTCTINYPATDTGAILFKLVGYQARFSVRNCTITQSSSAGGTTFDPALITALTSVEFYFNTISGGNSGAVAGGKGIFLEPFTGVKYDAYIVGNTLTPRGRGISVGADSDATPYDMGYIYIANNRITKQSTDEGHGVYLGLTGTDNENIIFENNYVNVSSRDDEYALVIKSTGVTAINNECIGDYACDIKGGQGVLLRNNKLTTTGKYALWIEDQPAAGANPQRFPQKFSVENNIINGSGGEYSVYATDQTYYTACNFDRNLYYGGSVATFFIDGDKTFAQWQAYWLSNGTTETSKVNDSASKVQNPGTATGLYLDMDGTKEWVGIPQSSGSSDRRARYSGLY